MSDSQPSPLTEDVCVLPASFGQRRLWFLDQIEPAGTTYNISLALRLHGPCDHAALARALQQIVARHEVLRCGFELDNNEPVQIIRDHVELPLEQVDAHDGSEATLQALVQELANKGFNLSQPPLLRTWLVRVNESDHVLVLSVHHIVADAWSLGILLDELATGYTAITRGSEPQLPPLEIQYGDFAEWQQAWLQGPEPAQQVDYWRERLAGAPPVLELPTDRPRPRIQSHRGSTRTRTLRPELAQQLNELAQEESCTLFILLLTAFKVLLARYSGAQDIVVGTPIAARGRRELEPLIGFFVNTLALRSDLSGNPAFRELLAQVRGSTLDAYSHQELPFEKLVEELEPERALSYSPVFQVMFVLEHSNRRMSSFGALKAEAFPVRSDTAKFDLSLFISDGPGELCATLEYNTDLFDATSIDRLLKHYTGLLEGIVANPGTRLADLPLLDTAEFQQVTHAFNTTGTDFGVLPLVHQWVEQVAADQPDAVAIETAHTSITYAELNSKANRLARAMIACGAGPGQRVAIVCDRDALQGIAVLAVLKAGAAYVPIDPHYPSERIEYMLADSNACLQLHSGVVHEGLVSDAIDLREFDFCSGPDTNPDIHVSPADPLYTIYTSGSTGQPKGVVLCHAGLANLIRWQQTQSGLDSPARTLQFASLSFDVSFQEFFSTWCQAGTVVMISETLRRDLPALARFISEQCIERMYLPYAALQPLADLLAQREDLPLALQDVVSAGEQLQVTDAMRHLFQRCHARLHNQYGPSETHVVTSLTLQGEPQDWPVLPCIGRPIANARSYVLDGQGRPTPIGVPGELYLAGIQVALEYFRHPELTTTSFLPDPFVSGERMYRTGDRARFRADGMLEFLGRMDEQFKFRGFRIEPGEIESALLLHPGIRLAAAALHGEANDPASRKLIAYIVAEPGQEPDTSELRRQLASQLPEHMVPTHFMLLETMPLTPSGKIARRLLPAPDRAGATADRYVAPRNQVEQELAVIWANVLDIEQVGIHDNFFELGGHSLLATKLIARIRDAFGTDIPLLKLFEGPTIAELGLLLEHRTTTHQVLIPQRDPAAHIPLSFAQQRLWFLDQLEPGNPAYNFPIAVELGADVDTDVLESAINDLVTRHEILRTRFVTDNEQARQIVEPVLHIDLVIDRETCATAETLQDQLTVLSQQPFDLNSGPLLRATLLSTGRPEVKVLLLVAHHIVTDGWSLQIMLDELATFYRSRCTAEPANLKPLAVQYGDYAVWQRAHLATEELDRQLAFWTKQLADLPPILDLPTDYPRPAEQRYRGHSALRTLPSELLRNLESLARQQDSTLFMVTLAAFDVLLGIYANTDTVVVGTPIAGRQHTELEPLIGFLANTLALPAYIGREQSFVDLLQKVRATTLAAYEHQDLPFEKLVEELQPQRAMSHAPIFQVMFVFRFADNTQPDFGPVSARPFSFEMGIAKFDLLLEIDVTDNGLYAGLQYDSDLFSGETISRMLEHLQTLLEAIVVSPEAPLHQLSLVSKREQIRLLTDFNATSLSLPDMAVHRLVEAQVTRTPTAVALRFGELELSYAELNARANRLAHALRIKGAGPGSFIAICAERGIDAVVAILAVLKAGATYVPVDPLYPGERIAFMLADCRAEILLTQSLVTAGLPACSAQTLCLDTFDWENGPANNLDAEGDSVYLIYTSGSTGKPKGVELTHKGLSNLIQWQIRQPGLDMPARTLQFASLSFDVSFQELFTTWSQGGTLVLLSEEQRRDFNALARFIASSGIERVYLPFAALQPLAEATVVVAETDIGYCVRDIIIAGEQLQITPAVRRLLSRLGQTRLHNHYGPSETHVVTAFSLEGNAETWMPLPPIGRPVANTQIYILNSNFQPVPVGVPGELFIGGVQVARGYHNRPELNAASFLPDPYDRAPEARMYRTGDRARFLANGNVEYLGRMDDQLKWRGFRIEPGEIETVLATHPAVRQAVVLLREESPADKRLVAYIVGDEADGEDIRTYSRQHLPEYMVPSAVMVLKELPLTPSGKVARRLLPAPDYGHSTVDYVAPRNSIEETLAGMWADILSLPQVGIHDDFFELGGHSLLATRLVSRIRDTLNVELPLKFLFRGPTVAQAAEAIATIDMALDLNQTGAADEVEEFRI